MADPLPSQVVPDSASSTVTITPTDTQDGEVPTMKLRLQKPKRDKKVQWTSETVDNEEMNKKKSKCCCIYKKPKKYDESSSDEEDDECEHCQGHVEKKRLKQTSEISTEAPVNEEEKTPNIEEEPILPPS